MRRDRSKWRGVKGGAAQMYGNGQQQGEGQHKSREMGSTRLRGEAVQELVE